MKRVTYVSKCQFSWCNFKTEQYILRAYCSYWAYKLTRYIHRVRYKVSTIFGLLVPTRPSSKGFNPTLDAAQFPLVVVLSVVPCSSKLVPGNWNPNIYPPTGPLRNYKIMVVTITFFKNSKSLNFEHSQTAAHCNINWNVDLKTKVLLALITAT